MVCSVRSSPWVVGKMIGTSTHTFENCSSGNASVWFSGYARNLPLQVSLAVKEAGVNNALKSFIFPQNELMPPNLPPRDCKQICSCPVLLFNKHFVEFSKLFNICSEMFASLFRSCVTELPCRQWTILESSLVVPLLSVGQTGSLQLFCGFHRIQMTDLLVTEQILQF